MQQKKINTKDTWVYVVMDVANVFFLSYSPFNFIVDLIISLTFIYN